METVVTYTTTTAIQVRPLLLSAPEVAVAVVVKQATAFTPVAVEEEVVATPRRHVATDSLEIYPIQ